MKLVNRHQLVLGYALLWLAVVVVAYGSAAVTAIAGVMDYGVDTVHNLWDGFNYLYHNFMEAAGYGVGRAHAYTSAATSLASNVASSTINTAANVANTAAGYVAGTASMAYDAAATTANKTYDAAASAADTAYTSAATAAGTTYEAGRSTVQAGRETAEYAKERTAVAVDKGVSRAELAAEDARRGYEMVSDAVGTCGFATLFDEWMYCCSS
jgi:hypothetical protein